MGQTMMCDLKVISVMIFYDQLKAIVVIGTVFWIP